MKIFYEFIKNKDNFLVVHDFDVDGICSASLISIALSENRKKFKNIASRLENDTERIERLSKKYRNVIFLDIGDVKEDFLEMFDSCMIIDHHPVKEYPEDIVYINPRLKSPNAYIPCSYMVKSLVDKKYEWISLAGTIGDMGFDLLKPFKINEKNWKKTKIGKVALIIDSVKVISGKKECEKLVDFIVKNRSMDSIIKEYNYFYSLYKKELDKLIKDFRKNKEVFGDFVLYQIFSKYRFTSTLATIISRKIKNKTIIISQKHENKIKVSLRSNIINLNSFLNKVLKGIEAKYGGHPKAAAITFYNESDYEKFIERIKSSIF
ncbi:MAG: DHHA1 domain-containing protein [Candidatus Aenigmatarchaeota archaeon]